MSDTGTRRRRAVSEDEKSQRRDEIMSAAKEVFARKGFHATTVADIAKQAGLAYGLIYWYFDSKDALFHALMAVEEAALRAHVAAALAAVAGPRDAGARDTGKEVPFRAYLQACVQATFEFFEADRATVRLLFRDAHALGDRFEKHLGGIYERFIDDIEAGVVAAQERGEVITAPPRMVAYTLAALVGQLAHRRLSTDDGVAAAQVADFVVSLVLDGLRPRPPAPGLESTTDSSALSAR
ncbi:TetR/AcrR family transcriptional regulator [Mycobacterium shinjukuense]|uniref:TetR family transcriptional regulator n=1 Tax=Mycobacterium shinjukuense TaxID=398694 RepID=A0A7I7MR79_9MYCO|nr:TetR/AcrR family transcriptional regulator [Mycobacterium shinjukuense]MCV6985874.1 TetR/AcrR family transcriptional regulator [Mycobacterium shinjukuense]ORB71735.1 TetR family transcriptional regulator [Mycobacterium shinjukuense]BBX73759.1 TetR family transcriptional regulator [Mycobacterium shinjukuense]